MDRDQDKRKRSKRSQYIEYGGSTDAYTWDQWEDEVQITVPGFKGKQIVFIQLTSKVSLPKKLSVN